jgi:hypothetical protein
MEEEQGVGLTSAGTQGTSDGRSSAGIIAGRIAGVTGNRVPPIRCHSLPAAR